MNLAPLAIQKFFDNAGNPLSGGKLFTYVTGTTTKLATYTDVTGGAQNTNPIILDFRGEARIWLDQTLTYRFVLAPANDTDPPTNPIWSVDDITAAVTFVSLTQQIIGQLLYPRTAAEIAAGVTPVNYAYVPGDIRRYGAKIDGSTDDTAAVQTAIDLAGSAVHAPTGQILGVKGLCMVSQINFTSAGIRYTANGMIFRGNATSATTAIVQVKTGNGNIFQDLAVDGNLNSNYQCGIHWYTNNLNLYYPGNCRFTGSMTVTSCLVGLCIGGLPSQALPLPAQGTTQADGIATDAPLSESFIEGFQSIACINAIYMAQPNGKVFMSNPVISGSSSGWAGHFGTSGYTAASTCALIAKLDATQANELYISGGAVENIADTTGTFIQCYNSHIHFDGATIEACAPSFIAFASNVTFDHCLDMGWNFSTAYSPFLVDPAASGILSFTDCTIGYPSADLTGTTGAPFVKGASNLAGTFAVNTKGFSVNFQGVELRDVPAAPLSGVAAYNPTVSGLQSHFENSKYTSYNGTPAITIQYDMDDGLDILRGTIDQSNYIITAYGANGNAAIGGWTFAVSNVGTCQWGSAAATITIIEKVIDKCLKLFAPAAQTTQATSPKFGISPQRPYTLRGWVQGGVTGSQITIQLLWFKFDGTASGTVSTNLLNAADTAIGATFVPFQFLAMPPKDCSQAQVVLIAANGATMQIADLNLR